MLKKILIIVLYITTAESRDIALNKYENCHISIDYKTGDFKEPQPLILSRNKIGINFLYPNDKEGYVNIHPLGKIILACPGKYNYLQGIKGIIKNRREVELTCIRQKTFRIDDDFDNIILFNITNVKCKYLPENNARITSERCFKNTTFVELGFRLENIFLRTISVCHNKNSQLTYYTKYELTSKILYQQSCYPRPRRWKSGSFFAQFNMENLYKMTTQLNTVIATVGSEKLAKKYLTPGTVRYLSRGHMVAKADFVYGNAQRSTFWYVNAAPQWQSFNGGNWNTLEDNVRKFTAKHLLNLDVYTGIHEQMKLIDINGNPAPLYLFVNGTHKYLPVPQYYWKIIYDPVMKLGTAFVGLNDPYIMELNDEIFICDDISSKIKWLTWDANKITKGISYACTIDDIRKSIPTIPKLEVYDILI